MKKKIFKITEKFNKSDIKIILIVIAVLLVTGFSTFNVFIYDFNNNHITLKQFIYILLQSGIKSVLYLFPVLLIYIVIRKNEKRHQRQNSTFEVINDIEYYRNDFGTTSPALISLMIDLNIDDEKDIAAMLLYYKLNNIVEIINNKVILKSNVILTKTDEKFFEWFNHKTTENLMEWKKSVKQDGIDQGYISKEKNKNNIILILGVIVITILILLAVFKINFAEFILSNGMIVFFFVGLPFLVAEKYNKKNIKRTKKGHEFTEKIYAMKNFIHDFGNFSQKTKDSLVLWEYFLIYAIVLEENEEILKEIKGYYNQDINYVD